jgi:glyoxylase-like metal-dependent hydrolase (beta-lactamase superfamily II)
METEAPVVYPIRACRVTLPPEHPEGPGPCDVFVFLILDQQSTYLVDTGVGIGCEPIERRFQPERADLLEELARRGVGPADLAGVICSHLHFDHCGNNRLFRGVPIFVQRLEYEAALTRGYTVPEWLGFEGSQYRLLDGSVNLDAQVRIVATPGHTIGHQSVAVSGCDGPALIVAQAAYSAAEFQSYLTPTPQHREDVWSMSAYVDSVRCLHELQPRVAYFTHDATVWKAESRDRKSA